jgi:hypothetical protein
MVRSFVAIALSLAWFAPTVVACSKSRGGDGATDALCSGAVPSAGPYSATCSACEQSSCASQTAAVTNACAPWLTCLQACTCSDSICLTGCASTIDDTCRPASTDLTTCAQTSCATACAQPSSDAGDQTASCAALATCCPTILGGASAISGCNAVVALNVDGTCATQLTNYQSNGECVGPVDAGTLTANCASLNACCATLTDPGAQAACAQVVALDRDASCEAALAGYLEAGTCH